MPGTTPAGQQSAQELQGPTKHAPQAGRLTQRWALLPTHGLLRKVTGTHRYLLTPKGRTVITALLAARQASVDQLNKLAA